MNVKKPTDELAVSSDHRDEDEARARESVDWSVSENELEARVSMINPTNQC